MKPNIIDIELGPITSLIFKACERECVFDCCGLGALEIKPVWIVGVFEDDETTELSSERKMEVESELEATLSEVAECNKEKSKFIIPKHFIRCDRQELNQTLEEIRSALDTLSKNNSFKDLIAGKYQ